jgi:hypothetical protein
MTNDQGPMTKDGAAATLDEQRLVLLLRAFGAICLAALVPLWMPGEWIRSAHEWLGWGTFPEQPVAMYMARSNSALAAFYGGLLWVLATDVRRYRAPIRYQAAAILVYSAAGIVQGRAAGMPWWFVVGDFVGCAVFCVPMWLIAKRLCAPLGPNFVA